MSDEHEEVEYLDEDGPPSDDAAQVVVPWEQISADALHGIIMEFVSREGTDHGLVEVSMDEKVKQVKRQLETGSVLVLFDAASKSVNLVTRRDFEQSLRGRSPAKGAR